MTTLKTTVFGLGLTLLCNPIYAQEADTKDSLLTLTTPYSSTTDYRPESLVQAEIDTGRVLLSYAIQPDSTAIQPDSAETSGENLLHGSLLNDTLHQRSLSNPFIYARPDYKIDLKLKNGESDFFLNNRRNRYSALWAFTSLNYLYADLVGLMDKNILNQYQNGVVDGTKITPGFLTVAAGFMQIPLANVFLPQVIRNEKTLRWVQIASGTLMTLVQSGTLFMGKPAPHYVLFSTVEIGTTAYITIDTIKWKTKKK